MQDPKQKDSSNSNQTKTTKKSQQKNGEKEMYLNDTIETFIYEKQALEFKLQHNIVELSVKNVYLTTVLKELTLREFQSIQQQTNFSKEIIKTCMQLQDDLASLDALEKKTQILKFQAQQLEKYFEVEPTIENKQNQ